MSINWGSIKSKKDAYIKSTAGQKKIEDCIKKYTKNDVRETDAGSKVITISVMKEAANELINLMKTKASGTPDSVIEHFNSLDVLGPYESNDGEYIMGIYFKDDVSRVSLYEEKYPEGLRNIVALFNNGYSAGDYVYGYWDGHTPSSASSENVLRQHYGASYTYIRSLRHRDGMHFINNAVDEFIGKHGTEYNVTAEVGPEYR